MISDRLVLIGVAVLSAVGTAGWIRQTPSTQVSPAMNFASPGLEAQPLLPVQTIAFNGPNSERRYPARSAEYQSRALRSRPAYDDRRVYDYRGSTIENKRSTAKSAAIIGGGAAAGAAIGGLAGGGKGAAIGAITGGAGGYVYDRATRNKQDRVNAPYRSRSSVYNDDRRIERSTGEKAAIIGGGAAAGAAIGGLAGGGKGAAIGAITGGAGGYIYDRVTRNK